MSEFSDKEDEERSFRLVNETDKQVVMIQSLAEPKATDEDMNSLGIK